MANAEAPVELSEEDLRKKDLILRNLQVTLSLLILLSLQV